MSPRADRQAAKNAARPPKVGLFGLLGSGNTGNDVSMESILSYLRSVHPDAAIDAMCGDPKALRAKYGINGIPVLWYHQHDKSAPGIPANVLKVLGKGIDAVRTASWVRRHDVVIVPGAGALEATLPVRPFGFPYSMFLLCASGRIFGTKVALVSVGASMIKQPLTRRFLDGAARLAFYRSYRDETSREAMRRRGIDTSADNVYPDLAFAATAPPTDIGDLNTVGLGVMAYYGSNDEKLDAGTIHTAYVANMKSFTRWLLDNGHRVRLFGGDSKFDYAVAQEILADVRNYRPELGQEWASVTQVQSFGELMEEMASVGVVVATRYHNVLCALKSCKPTIALGYSQKFMSLMSSMGLAEFCQPASELDGDLLIKQFTELKAQSSSLRQAMIERNAENTRLLNEQFARLSAELLPGSNRRHEPATDVIG